MTGLFDVELEQDVLVVADPGCLDLGQHLARQRRNLGRGVEDALTLTATAADRLQTEAPPGLIGEQLGGLLAECLGELVDRIEVDLLPIRGL